MILTVIDQHGNKFWASNLDDAVNRCKEYAEPGDAFSVWAYGKDINEPWPGYVAVKVYCDEHGTKVDWRVRHKG